MAITSNEEGISDIRDNWRVIPACLIGGIIHDIKSFYSDPIDRPH